MNFVMQSRTQIQYRALLVASILALGVCLIGRPVGLIAADASPAAAKESAEKKDVDASKKVKSEPSDSKPTNGKSDHKDSANSSTSSGNSKAKSTTTKHEVEKPSKGEKVRLAMLTLKDSLPETAEQAGPFGENKLDMR